MEYVNLKRLGFEISGGKKYIVCVFKIPDGEGLEIKERGIRIPCVSAKSFIELVTTFECVPFNVSDLKLAEECLDFERKGG